MESQKHYRMLGQFILGGAAMLAYGTVLIGTAVTGNKWIDAHILKPRQIQKAFRENARIIPVYQNGGKTLDSAASSVELKMPLRRAAKSGLVPQR